MLACLDQVVDANLHLTGRQLVSMDTLRVPEVSGAQANTKRAKMELR